MLPPRQKPKPFVNYQYPTLAPQAQTIAPPELQRAFLAARGADPAAINAGQTSLTGNFARPPTPPGGITFQLANYRGGPAAFQGGGQGYRPLAANQGGTPAPSPMQAFGAQIPRLPPRTASPPRPALPGLGAPLSRATVDLGRMTRRLQGLRR
jgi:hypothetical protein